MMNGRFLGRTAIVTGGASGIGAATAALFAREGARVLVGDLDAPDHGLMDAKSGAVSSRRCDVAVRRDVEALVKEAVAVFGRLDILVNNAGMGGQGATPDLDPDLWHRTMAVNLDSVFFACRAAIPHMRAQGSGAIVNTASISGLGGDYGLAAYNASKGAVVNYTRSLAVEHARDHIRVNALCPGLIDTPILARAKQQPGLFEAWVEGIPLGRAGRAEEMAERSPFWRPTPPRSSPDRSSSPMAAGPPTRVSPTATRSLAVERRARRSGGMQPGFLELGQNVWGDRNGLPVADEREHRFADRDRPAILGREVPDGERTPTPAYHPRPDLDWARIEGLADELEAERDDHHRRRIGDICTPRGGVAPQSVMIEEAHPRLLKDRGSRQVVEMAELVEVGVARGRLAAKGVVVEVEARRILPHRQICRDR